MAEYRFGSGGVLIRQELPLGPSSSPEALGSLRVVIRRGPGRSAFELVGPSSAADWYRVGSARGLSAGRMPNWFTVTDLFTGVRRLYSPGASLVWREVPIDEMSYVRIAAPRMLQALAGNGLVTDAHEYLDIGAEHMAVVSLSGKVRKEWRLEAWGSGQAVIVPVETGPGRLIRMVIDPVTELLMPESAEAEPGIDPVWTDLLQEAQLFQNNHSSSVAQAGGSDGIRGADGRAGVPGGADAGKVDLFGIRWLDHLPPRPPRSKHTREWLEVLDPRRVEEAVPRARDGLLALGQDPRDAHGLLRELRAVALESLAIRASLAVEVHLGRAPRGTVIPANLSDFIITPLGVDTYGVVHQPSSTRFEFCPDGFVRETPLRDVPPELAGLRVRLRYRGAKLRPEGIVASSARSEGLSVTSTRHGTKVEGGFTVTNQATRNVFRFGPEGTLVNADLRLSQRLPTVRVHFGDPGRRPELRRSDWSVLGNRWSVSDNRLSAEYLYDGRVALVRAGWTVQRMVFNSGGELAEEVLAVPGGGAGNGYFRLDYAAGRAERLDASGQAIAGQPEAVIDRRADGRIAVVDAGGGTVFERPTLDAGVRLVPRPPTFTR
jgi:hypothetical protein